MTITPEEVLARLERAGATLLALLVPGVYPAGLRCGMPEVVQESIEAYGYTGERLRPATPSAAEIAAMDEALAWIAAIPADRVVIRRIVGARALVSPTTGRHLYSWRRIATTIGADPRAVQRWHAQGIEAIAGLLRQRAGLAVQSPPRGAARAITKAARRATVPRDTIGGVQTTEFG